MKMPRVYADETGESHFGVVDVEFGEVNYIEGAPPIGVAGPYPAERVAFLKIPDGWSDSCHPSPSRQYVMVLSGEAEFTTSDGEVRVFGKGEAFLLEDLTGKGHGSRFAGQGGFVAIQVRLA